MSREPWNNGDRGPVMPRKPLDIKLTDYPFSKERSKQLLSLPSRRGTGVGRAHKTKAAPANKAGANVSIILGHFQKRLTEDFANTGLLSPILTKPFTESIIFFHTIITI